MIQFTHDHETVFLGLTALRDLALRLVVEPGVVDADGSLRGNTDDKLLVRGRENIRLGMAEQQAAETST